MDKSVELKQRVEKMEQRSCSGTRFGVRHWRGLSRRITPLGARRIARFRTRRIPPFRTRTFKVIIGKKGV